MTKNIFAAAALIALASSVAVAQTDFGSPLGAGGGVGGSIAPLGVPGGNGPGGTAGNSGVNAGGLNTARGAFLAATGGGVTVQNPGGGTVTVPQAAAQALGGVLGGNPNAGQVQALNQAFGGSAAGNALTNALQSFGASPSFNNLVTAIQAYNTAITTLPAGGQPTPALLAARQALAAASGRGAEPARP